jgi:hypothetical protein
MIDVMISVDLGSEVPVYGSQRGPESDAAMMRESNNQNLRFVGAFSRAGNPALRRTFRRRRCRMSSGIQDAPVAVKKGHSQSSESPNDL